MRKLAFLMVLCACIPAMAQRYSKRATTTTEEQTVATGTLVVNQDPRMDKLLQAGPRSAGDSISVEMPGYRVQIYSNNNPKKAKSEAFALQKLFKNNYPQMTVYVTYAAPFWKVRIGDFTNHFEALVFARKLEAANPKMVGEIFVMQEDAVKPLYIKFSDNAGLTQDNSWQFEEKTSENSTQQYYPY